MKTETTKENGEVVFRAGNMLLQAEGIYPYDENIGMRN